MPPIVGKAFAYVTKGECLLLFTHPLSPEAWIQVPAGTMEPGESPEDAVLREAREETGLARLTGARFLGEYDAPRPDGGIHRRYFSHLRCEYEAPET